MPFALLHLLGCFAAQNTAASAEYARQVTTASLRVAQLEAQLTDSSARIEQLEEFVRAQGRSQATKMENLDQVNAEVTRLRGAIEVLQFEIATLKEDLGSYQVQQERRQLHDERRLSKIEGFLGVEAPPPPTDEEMGIAKGGDPDGVTDPTDPDVTPTEPAPQPDAPDGGTETPATARGKLDLAAEHMAAGRQAVARAVLQRAKTEHADAPEISEIEFRIAETYLNEKAYSKAALAFKRVIDDHPGSPWASWSMLRQGECFEGLGQTDNARLFYDGVIQRFPKSEAAKEAKKRLGR
ncbi:MAG: tetratricopeptide repeat protein [Alphaproteobacteria bacterium]|nr:tetratricopeptide repeat protein [Alphaproteobacteria bacterium]